jgi:hypothetical protein
VRLWVALHQYNDLRVEYIPVYPTLYSYLGHTLRVRVRCLFPNSLSIKSVTDRHGRPRAPTAAERNTQGLRITHVHSRLRFFSSSSVGFFCMATVPVYRFVNSFCSCASRLVPTWTGKGNRERMKCNALFFGMNFNWIRFGFRFFEWLDYRALCCHDLLIAASATSTMHSHLCQPSVRENNCMFCHSTASSSSTCR